MAITPEQRAADLRHDLRTPINHIIGYSELLLDDAERTARYAADLEHIRAAGKQLLAVVTDIADQVAGIATLDQNALDVQLRNPLNQIIGYSELLQEEVREDGNDALTPDLNKIERAAGHLLGLVSNWLADPQAGWAPVAGDSGLVDRATEPVLHVTGGRVLVVDDDALNRDVLTRRLQHEGHSVIQAANGREALQVLTESPCDLILLDVMMPELDGFETIQCLKADPSFHDIPVIMLSALDDMKSVVRCIALGAEDYLAKPFDPVLLRARIGACLEKKRLRDKEQEYLEAIRRERERADRLLMNILPEPVAQRLKENPGTIADYFSDVTVLFADIVGFTQLASTLAPADVVSALNRIFSIFDTIAEQHGLEKIKTIGDGYMAAAGLPQPRPDHATAAASAALEMLRAVVTFNREQGSTYCLRFGIHTGPVVAGVIGLHKFAYDLWGDTVNLASRMESHAPPGTIQLSPATAAHLSGFTLEPRGPIPVKGRGVMQTFLLHQGPL